MTIPDPYFGNELWPGNFQGCRIKGRFLGLDGTAPSGFITLTPSTTGVIDSAIPVTIVARPLKITLADTGAIKGFTGTDSSPGVVVPATDDPDVNPSNWTYHVQESWPGGRTYDIEAPQGTEIDLSVVAPVPSSSGVAITRGFSAYEIAVQQGFEGDINAWLDSLHGGGEGGGGGTGAWADITGKPSTFPPTITDGSTSTTTVWSSSRVNDEITDVADTVTAVSNVLNPLLDGSSNVKASKVSGLAAVATSGSASDITTGTLPQSVLPPLAINDVFTVVSQAAMLALTAQKGDMAIRSDLTPVAIFVLASNSPSTLADWVQLSTPSAAVASVAGRNGVVTLAKGDVGLGNVDNTADTGKAVLSATKFTTARNIAGKSFDGTADITIAKGDVGLGNVDNTADTGKAVASAAKLTTARNINGVAFDGTANITVADSTKVPTTTTVNGKALSGNIAIGSADISDLNESIQDMIATFLTAGYGLGTTYNDAGNALQVTLTNPVIQLGPTDPIPGGTPAGVIVIRTTT